VLVIVGFKHEVLTNVFLQFNMLIEKLEIQA